MKQLVVTADEVSKQLMVMQQTYVTSPLCKPFCIFCVYPHAFL